MTTTTPSGEWRFPDVHGRDLLGREYRMPTELPADVTVAILAFKQWQQAQVDAWIGQVAAAGIPATPLDRTGLRQVVLELPILPGKYQIARRFIDGGMAGSIKDPVILARTITVYGSVDRVCASLGITSRDDVSVRVVRRDGSVLWGTTGPVTAALVEEMLAVLGPT